MCSSRNSLGDEVVTSKVQVWPLWEGPNPSAFVGRRALLGICAGLRRLELLQQCRHVAVGSRSAGRFRIDARLLWAIAAMIASAIGSSTCVRLETRVGMFASR